MLLSEALKILENLRIDPIVFKNRFDSRIEKIGKMLGKKPIYKDRVLAIWRSKQQGEKKTEIIVYKEKDKISIKDAGSFANYKIFGKDMKADTVELTMKELFKKRTSDYLKRVFK